VSIQKAIKTSGSNGANGREEWKDKSSFIDKIETSIQFDEVGTKQQHKIYLEDQHSKMNCTAASRFPRSVD
jgi:hypothetical protein